MGPGDSSLSKYYDLGLLSRLNDGDEVGVVAALLPCFIWYVLGNIVLESDHTGLAGLAVQKTTAARVNDSHPLGLWQVDG